MNEVYDVIVIGAGQAGLAAGYHLKKNGLHYAILEANPEPTGSWPQYYDNLRLFSPASYSSLPGMPFPLKADIYPTRDEVISYLKMYAKHNSFPIHFNVRVDRVKKNEFFYLHTTEGEVYRTKNIICATGSFNQPFVPKLEGGEDFKGTIIHSSQYRKPDAYRNQRVIVVGRGNSAVQIGAEISEGASLTTLAVLQPVQLVPQRFLGKDVHFWMKIIGYDAFPFWRFGVTVGSPGGAIDVGGFKNKLREGQLQQKGMFRKFYSEGVIWSDGTKEKVDSIIFATGFKPIIPYLQGVEGALDDRGYAVQKGGLSSTVPGLYYLGLSGQRSFASATIRGVGSDAKYVVKHLKEGGLVRALRIKL
ncbi:monooxygenase [Paenibacillus sp. FSL H8-0548]|uniref:flavin-containing monooxygenase n=1 Tax=Paenibacillus sp. FSL H8-0548 TaxID=1920422 RepID=UPI00096F297A|nr:NAD(P)/FAD-dependent oxidoreductase [Paenibacillus sp. FSL H8-0548]OMF22582.1 monooxygenase [Paenibacillus sp. FSL H8-0548]